MTLFFFLIVHFLLSTEIQLSLQIVSERSRFLSQYSIEYIIDDYSLNLTNFDKYIMEKMNKTSLHQ